MAKSLFQQLYQGSTPGSDVPASAIYECSEGAHIAAFKKGEKFSDCVDCPAGVEHTWYRTDDVVHFVSKNLNTEFERVETLSIRIAEFIADFAGNIWFVYFHLAWFGLWIYFNTGARITTELGGFDPYPFPFLVLVVSLEAIFLATFILIAQNISSQRSELRADIDYQVNLKTEKEVAEILSILSDIREGRLTLKGKQIVMSDPKRTKRT